jgi:hypothetical protein
MRQVPLHIETASSYVYCNPVQLLDIVSRICIQSCTNCDAISCFASTLWREDQHHYICRSVLRNHGLSKNHSPLQIVYSPGNVLEGPGSSCLRGWGCGQWQWQRLTPRRPSHMALTLHHARPPRTTASDPSPHLPSPSLSRHYLRVYYSTHSRH